VWRLRDGIVLVDDSYNSNPQALQRISSDRRRTGFRAAHRGAREMLELGEQGIAWHQECGRAAAKAGVVRLITGRRFCGCRDGRGGR